LPKKSPLDSSTHNHGHSTVYAQHVGACDSRVLQRLVATVAEPDNVFARVFAPSELEGLRSIACEVRARPARGAARVQGDARFCVKRAIARLWRDENADCLLLPHAAAAEWLRAGAGPACDLPSDGLLSGGLP
jgi:hypothetical protein